MPASAGERGWYVAIEGGFEFDGTWNESSDAGFAGFATVGREIAPHLDIESEFGYRTTDDPYFEYTQMSAMVNAVYEVPLSQQVSVSIGAGVGIDNLHIDQLGWSPYYFLFGNDSDIQAAAQLKLGLSLQIGEATDIVATYRAVTVIENTSSELSDSTVSVGLRFEL